MTGESIDRLGDLLVPYFGGGPYISFAGEPKIQKRFGKKGIKVYDESAYRGKSSRYRLTLKDGEFEIALATTGAFASFSAALGESRRVTRSLLIVIDDLRSGIEPTDLHLLNGAGWAFSSPLTLSVESGDPLGLPLFVFATDEFVAEHAALFPN